MGNDRATVLARTIAGCLFMVGLWSMAYVPSAGASAPEAVCLMYADSLAVTIDGRLHLALNDFQGKDAELTCDDLSDIHLLMDSHLLAPLLPVDELDRTARYYVVTELLCQALSFDDVVKAERWLKQGSAAQEDSASDPSPSAGEVALRYLWDVAGLRPEKERGQTESFKLQDLRRLD